MYIVLYCDKANAINPKPSPQIGKMKLPTFGLPNRSQRSGTLSLPASQSPPPPSSESGPCDLQ